MSEVALMVGRNRVCALLMALLVCGASPREASADTYLGIIFGSQTHPKQLRYTHTWATFVRVSDVGAPGYVGLNVHTISWMPESMNVQTWTLRPVPGVNLDLEQTLRVVYDDNQHVTAWGPFILSEESYFRSLEIKQILESGNAHYRALSPGRDLQKLNCIHAVAAVDPHYGEKRYPLIRVGKPASRYMARQVMIRGPVDQTLYDNSWLFAQLGLDRYPITIVPPQIIPERTCFLCLCPE
jgi:hypothetical protein